MDAGDTYDRFARPLVSVVIPVYNAEKYLDQCLSSLKYQTLTNFEVLCVDDGSDDQSVSIINHYVQSDPRFKFFTQTHQFAGVARNLGIQHAKGEYLLFLDADDSFAPNLLIDAYYQAKLFNAQICVFCANSFDDKQPKLQPMPWICNFSHCPKDQLFSKETNPENIYAFTTSSPWSKLFKRQFILDKKIYFQDTKNANDLRFVLTALAQADRIVALDKVLVYYRINHGTSLQQTKDSYPTCICDALTGLKIELVDRGLFEKLKKQVAEYVGTVYPDRHKTFKVDSRRADKKYPVSSEQMIGTVNISRENTNLDDAANRNGIQEGIGFEQLKRVLLAVITEFERDRQYIGRKLAAYWKKQDESQKELEHLRELAAVRRQWEEERKKEEQSVNDSAAPTVNPDDVEKLIDSLTAQKEEEVKELQDEAKMLQTLATVGIVTNMFMHEIRTLTNNIGQELDAAFEAIKYDKDLDAAFQNIQQAIGFKKHFASWFNVTIDSIRKDKRKRKLSNISFMLKEFLLNWKAILKRNGVNLIFSCDEDIIFRCFAFDIENIISNLISNSLASFDREGERALEKKEIYLDINKREEGFILHYEDTGWGLSDKYKKRPDLITEAFESDKSSSVGEEDGTGMGMWIVKRTVLEYNGDIDLSENKTLGIGFKISISLGGKYV